MKYEQMPFNPGVPSPAQREPLLSAKQMAELLGFKRGETVHAMRQRGEIFGIKKGKQWRYFASDVFKTLKNKSACSLRQPSQSMKVWPENGMRKNLTERKTLK